MAFQTPAYSLSGGNQFPATTTAAPSQYPEITIVDAQGSIVSNIGNGPADGAWTTMTLTGATPDATFPPKYMKDSRGIVHCQGRLMAAVADTTIFTFPVGFRPITAPCYYHYNVSPNACYVLQDGTLLMANTLLADISVIHFATALL